jgi:predicted ATPase/DNA-binding SARP family transcriptional activator
MAVATSDSRRLEIRLFSEPAIYAGGTLQNIRLPSKSLELLCALALKVGQPQDRAGLAFTLWPDESEEGAKAELRRHLYHLRRAISPTAGEAQITVTKTTLMWQPDGPAAIDVVEFVRLSDSPDTLERAAAIYTGDLLAHVYEEWLEAPRERLRKQQLQNLLTLSNRHLQTDPKRSLKYVESALAIDPWDEGAVRCVMSARTNLGDRAGAVHAYSKFVQRLREEFGTEPTTETQRTFQTVKIAESRNNNLPRRLSSFVGREHVLGEIKPLIEKSRLVTLLGTGGVGKTRCAIQAGTELLDRYADGVWLAELSLISDPSLVVYAVARTLSVQESPNQPLLDSVVACLKRRQLLLILDNCEHVIDEVTSVVVTILRACPDVQILATSREPLNIIGEQGYRVPSLEVPPAGTILSTGEMLAFGAPLLFTDRACLIDSHFALSDENIPHVAEICRRLDGIPLAIELAAARVKMLSPQQLAQKLDERFRVLTGGDRSALPRHQAMRALIDWSYDLLSNDESALFRKLSIFAGSFSLQTAAAVCSKGEIDELAVLDLLSSLVDKSLIQAEPLESVTRYRLLESTRQYAREKLTDAGEEHVIVRAHARAFLALAEQLTDDWETMPDRAWFARVEPEMENFRAALSRMLEAQGDVLLAQRLAAALRPVWWSLAPAEGRRLIRLAQERVDDGTPTAVLAALDLAEAWVAGALLQYKVCLAAGARALTRYRELGEPLRVAEARVRAGKALVLLGDVGEGETLLQEALSEAHALGARRLVSIALEDLGIARHLADDVAGARQLFSEALTSARASGGDTEAARIAKNLGEAEFRGGNVTAALQLVREALSTLRGFDDGRSTANGLCNEAAYLVALRRYDEARVSAREALSAAHDRQLSAMLVFSLQHLAAISVLRPSPDRQLAEDRRRAARLLGYVNARLATLEALREYTEQQEYDKMLPALRDVLGADECVKLMAEGSTWSEDQAVAEAMLI